MSVVVNTVKVALNSALPTGSNVIGAVTQSGTWNIGSITTLPALASGTNTIGKLAANSGVDIGDVDVTSVTPGTAAGSLGKAEDTAHNSGDTGVAVWGVRNDFGNSFSGSDGDYTPFNVDAQGRLRTLLYGYDSGAMDHYEIAVTAGAVNVAQSGTWTVGVATTSGGLGKAEDAGFTTGDVGVMALAVRNNNAATTLTSADADYSPIAVDAAGVQFVKSPYRPTPYKLNSAATTNATSVSATANTLLLGYYISNTNSSVRYVKFYNKASAPTVGTDTPVLVLAIPGSGAANVSFPAGVNFSTGLAFATTTGAADSDTGAVALNEIIVNLVYATY